MLTKEIIAARVLSSKEGGQDTDFRKVDVREIYQVLETVRNGFLEQWMAEFGDLDGEFVTQYINIPVLCDSTTSQKYSILPTRLISFGDYDGLRQVSPMKNQKMSFIRLKNGGVMSFALLEAGLLAGNTGYYIERVKQGTDKSIRIYYQNIPNDFDKILVKQIASTYDFDEDEQLPIPARWEEMVIQEVAKQFIEQVKTPLATKVESGTNDKQ